MADLWGSSKALQNFATELSSDFFERLLTPFGHEAFDLRSCSRQAFRENLGSLISDDDIIFNSNSDSPPFSIHRGVIAQEIKSRLDCEHHARFQFQRSPGLIGVRTGIMNIEAQPMRPGLL
jgi:hypothetical protein